MLERARLWSPEDRMARRESRATFACSSSRSCSYITRTARSSSSCSRSDRTSSRVAMSIPRLSGDSSSCSSLCLCCWTWAAREAIWPESRPWLFCRTNSCCRRSPTSCWYLISSSLMLLCSCRTTRTLTILALVANLRVLCVSSAWLPAGVTVHITQVLAPLPDRLEASSRVSLESRKGMCTELGSPSLAMTVPRANRDLLM
mmetsp:Transcript_12532/g.35207  ORF Transcript_12532/g.35207 Transcript_12532/m.35207 type:complete len:202 (+) Transcript_12532:1492-2097(+)